MIKSMTGYGKGETKRDGYHVIAEIKTVNHRYSNIYLHIPNYLLALESTLIKMIKDKIDRGRVDLYLKIEEDVTEGRYTPQLNFELAKSYYTELKKLQKTLDFDQNLSMDTLISLPEVLKLKEVEHDEEILHGIIIETIEKSLDSLLQMRIHEGEELYRDLVLRLDSIEKEMDAIKEREPKVLEEYKERMRNRVNEFLEDKIVDEERLAMEIAILTERSCINEELVRLKSHIGQFRLNLEKGGAVGRKLDFIAQEMYREANTIGSKSPDAVISNHVVNIKSEIDKIREQIQNIE
ncbi:YicC family protein [Anoxybacter fermentans]|uniref:YicC family protein n=1 Tax=Anoxybacter fermentans TaxID=1323375 RepID=A0A3S9SXB7_9FIRM|nr:YicC/YloC family endoribonuclease [Anoxybacter fermentans]AZR72977.1 YicC family protein [Anoxybacter fermentans]